MELQIGLSTQPAEATITEPVRDITRALSGGQSVDTESCTTTEIRRPAVNEWEALQPHTITDEIIEDIAVGGQLLSRVYDIAMNTSTYFYYFLHV
jgi:hypothetical protein